MRYKQDQKEQTREKIIAAAGRCFRKGGFVGIGVDGLAKEAGVTSGAFYGHFSSKAEAFKTVVVSGMEGLRNGVASFQQQYGVNWWEEFTKYYMGPKRTCDLSDSCLLQSLTPEMGRSEESLRQLFETELLKIIKLAAESGTNTADQASIDKTWASFAMLIGGVTLARAVADKKLSDQIGAAIQNAVNALQRHEEIHK
jgi:AcrR family transcriptional regulator